MNGIVNKLSFKSSDDVIYSLPGSVFVIPPLPPKPISNNIIEILNKYIEKFEYPLIFEDDILELDDDELMNCCSKIVNKLKYEEKSLGVLKMIKKNKYRKSKSFDNDVRELLILKLVLKEKHVKIDEYLLREIMTRIDQKLKRSEDDYIFKKLVGDSIDECDYNYIVNGKYFGLDNKKSQVIIDAVSIVNYDCSELNLSDSKIGDDGTKYLMVFSGRIKNIEFINLKDCNIGDDGMRIFSKFLKSLPNLLELNIGWNKIRNYGIKELSKYIKYVSNLTELIIESIIYFNVVNEISDEGIIALCNQLKYIPKLTNFSLYCIKNLYSKLYWR